VKNKKHLYLLPEMDLFVTDEPHLVFSELGNPNEYKKGQTRIIIEDSLIGIDLKW
jgi:hypothetical protein